MKRFNRNVESCLMRFTILFPFKWLRAWAAKDLVVINYHSIQGWDPDPTINKNIYRTVDQLEKDLQFFQKQYSIINASDLINNHALPKNALAITIDDGLQLVYSLMYPVFRKAGIKPALFINPDFVDNKDVHFIRKRNLVIQQLDSLETGQANNLAKWMNERSLDVKQLKKQLNTIQYHQRNLLDELLSVLDVTIPDFLSQNPVYLSIDEITKVLNDGFELGGHSMDHAPFEQLSLEEQTQQVKESMQWVAERFNLDYRMFAFPSDDRPISKKLFTKIKDDVDITFGVQGLKKDVIPHHYHRITIESSQISARQAIKFEYLKYIFKRLMKKSVVKRAE
nr:polysaccharide deacetylase family protein [uncultured Carboxylicivirga sp.]